MHMLVKNVNGALRLSEREVHGFSRAHVSRDGSRVDKYSATISIPRRKRKYNTPQSSPLHTRIHQSRLNIKPPSFKQPPHDHPKTMLTTSSPKPRKTSPALEAILSNFGASEDLLSGSESSSLVASPVEEMSAFSLPAFQHQNNRKSMHPERARQQPIELVLDFLENMMSGTDAAERSISDEAVIEYCGHSMPHSTSKDTKTEALNQLKATCTAHDLQIDSIFGLGGDVAVFGNFTHKVRPSMGVERSVNFSIWAEVDIERGRIVRLRWLDQIVRGEDSSIDESGTL
jgi:hypothetical protein